MENLGEFIINHWLLVTLFVVLASLVMSGTLNQKLSGFEGVGANRAVQIVNQQKGVFLDIRETSEHAQGSIAESVSMPLSTLAETMPKLKKPDQAIVLVCASGQRGKTAAKQLKSNGYSNVYVLTGGLNAWRDAKLPLFS